MITSTSRSDSSPEGAPGEAPDVLVVGGGLAGLSAAIQAASQGAEVLLVEKETEVGGSTVLSGGFFAFAGTDMQRDRGIHDSEELLRADLETVGGGYSDPSLLDTYVSLQLSAYGWLTDLGIRFSDLELSSGQSAPRSHRTDPTVLIKRLRSVAVAHPSVRVRTGTSVDRLTRQGPDGRVNGVRLTSGERSETISGLAGVVIASGGFSRSKALMDVFAPGQSDAVRIGGRGNTGDGLRMAWHLGADMRDMGFIRGTFGAHPSATDHRHEILLAFYEGAIIVNFDGERFIDESLSYKLLGDACLGQPGAVAFQIWDESIMRRSQSAAPLFNLTEAFERGLVVSAATLGELARKLDVDAKALVDTVSRYNQDVLSGQDQEFGRDGLCNHAGDLATLDHPPFYGYLSTSALLATYCGLRIDRSTAVLDVFGEPIDGLYAAGEVTGGFHGNAYMTGTSLGKALIFGRLAGSSAVCPQMYE